MNTRNEVLIVIGSLLGATIFVCVLLYFTSPFISLKRRIHFTCCLIVVSISSVFSFYHLVPLPVFIYLSATVFIYWASFVKPGLRHIIFRLVISWPANLYQGVCILMIPFLWLSWLYWKWITVVMCGIMAVGFVQSWFIRREYVYFSAHLPNSPDQPNRGKVVREKYISHHSPLTLAPGNRLRIAQITDPHLGLHMSAERLHHICEKIAEWNPDLVFITGDLITVESYFEKDKIVYSFAPLTQLSGKVYACLGNHDYESLAEVEAVFTETGIRLLRDSDVTVTTPVGTVQIIGTEFTWARKREEVQARITEIVDRLQTKEHFRIWLVHNPGEFMYFPDGSVDMMFSGHTHGGQIGLQSFGIKWTLYHLLTREPDFGLWRKGSNLMYVHRGTGFQGFPVRLGVSNELSLLTITV